MMKAISFRLYGRFGHFMRAETGTSALSYPVPPRTVILGILGAVLGLEKDTPQQLLEPFQVAVAGGVPITHWHKAKLRKDPPTALPQQIKRTQKLDKDTKWESVYLLSQEWLFKPAYTLWAVLPEPYHSELDGRLKERCWYYQPSLGLTEMSAEVDYLGVVEIEKLPNATYNVSTIMRQDQVSLDLEQVYDQTLGILLLRMPRTVNNERVFSHSAYIMEKDGRTVPVNTANAYRGGDDVLMFL